MKILTLTREFGKKTIIKKITIFLLFFCFSFGFSQENPPADSLAAKTTTTKKKNKIIWLPVLASSPANGFMFGVAPAMNWKTVDNPETSFSSLLGSFIFTTKKQFLFTLKGNIFYDHNTAILMQDIRYFITSQPTYGLGTGPASSKLATNGFQFDDGSISNGISTGQLMKFNFLRIYETYFKKIGTKGLYGGIGYGLDAHSKITDQLLDLSTTPQTITSHYAYSKKYGFHPTDYVLSGVSANLMFDRRDNTINPYKGAYALATIKFNPTFLGSYKYSSSLWLEGRTYINLSKARPRNLIALWMYGNFEMGGKLPYLDLPAQGWDQYGRSGRGYAQGRWRGESLLYGEIEWRFPLQKNKEKLGGVLFLNGTSATNPDANIKMFRYINPGYGMGLRYMINEKSRTNLCLDYAFGSYGSKGFYLGVNEAF